MNYKCLSFATALMLAASPCLGVRTDLGCSDLEISAFHSGPCSPLMSIERQRIEPLEGPSGVCESKTYYPSCVARNSAILCKEDYRSLGQGVPAHEIIEAAKKRLAREHGVPQKMAWIFSMAMEKKDKKSALLYCIWLSISPKLHKHFNEDFRGCTEHFLTQLLQNLAWIDCDHYNKYSVIQHMRSLYCTYIMAGMTFDGAATLLLKSHLSESGETMPDPNLDPLIESLPVPVRLGASTMGKSASFMKMALAWVASQDEERALASLSFLTKCRDEEQGSAFMAASSALSPAYMLMFVHDWPAEMTRDEFTFILAQGDLTKEQLKGLKFSDDRQAIYASRMRVEDSLFARLLESLAQTL